jgi:hypothetical protein
MKSSVKASRHTVGLLAMHHIYCPTKRDHIETRALQHDLSGMYLYGKPGMVVVEGNVDAVGQYIRFIRGLRWQACVCMGRVARVYHVDETLPAWEQEHTPAALTAAFQSPLSTTSCTTLRCPPQIACGVTSGR